MIERGGRLFLRKNCPEHGIEESPHIFDMPVLYHQIKRIFCANQLRPAYPNELVAYLTRECNLHCPVCYMGANDGPKNELTQEALFSILSVYKGRAVHLSGGEPTLRGDLFEIIRKIKEMGFFAGVFTNGLKLSDFNYVRELKNAGMDLAIVSLESLRSQDYLLIAGKDILKEKLKAIHNLKKEKTGVYLFSYIAEGLNEDQINPLIDFAKDNIEAVDILNFTPIWKVGRFGKFNRIPASGIYSQLKTAGFSLEEFILNTEFSFLSFEILSKLLNGRWVRQPPCEQMVYLFKIKSGFIKIGDLVSLPYLIKRFGRINRLINSRPLVFKWGIFLLNAPFFYFIKEIFINKRLRALLKETLGDIISSRTFKRAISKRKLTIMTGQVHSFDDADFRFINKCTLYAVDEEGKNMLSFCTRQMRALH